MLLNILVLCLLQKFLLIIINARLLSKSNEITIEHAQHAMILGIFVRYLVDFAKKWALLIVSKRNDFLIIILDSYLVGFKYGPFYLFYLCQGFVIVNYCGKLLASGIGKIILESQQLPAV